MNSFVGSPMAEGSPETLKGKALVEMMSYSSKQDTANVFLTVHS